MTITLHVSHRKVSHESVPWQSLSPPSLVTKTSLPLTESLPIACKKIFYQFLPVFYIVILVSEDKGLSNWGPAECSDFFAGHVDSKRDIFAWVQKLSV